MVRKGYERVIVWDVSWRLKKNCNILTPNSSGYSSTSFSSCGVAQRRGLSSPLGLVLTASNCNNWLQTLISNKLTSCRTGLYNCLTTTCFSERRICTQLNPSTVKVIHWYLRPDAPVIYTGAFLIWQLGRVGGQYVTHPHKHIERIHAHILNTHIEGTYTNTLSTYIYTSSTKTYTFTEHALAHTHTLHTHIRIKYIYAHTLSTHMWTYMETQWT